MMTKNYLWTMAVNIKNYHNVNNEYRVAVMSWNSRSIKGKNSLRWMNLKFL